MKNVAPILFYCFAGVRLLYRPFAQQNSKFGLPLLVFIFQICYATGLHATTASVSNFILPDGTLNKPALSGQSLSLNSAGWNVTLDPTRGPVFAPAPPPGAEFTALNKGLNGTVLAIAVSGTDVYVGGVFAGVGSGGTPVSGLNNIAKWNGTSWSALGTGLNGNVTSIAISGSDVYVGGAFTDVGGGGTSVPGLNRIAKWNGTGWSALNMGLNSFVRTIGLSGADVYVGGGFTDVGSGGTPVSGLNNIAKWSSTSGTWSALDKGISGIITAIAISGTDIYAGGSFSTVGSGGTPVAGLYNIAKWSGSSWSALGNGTEDPENGLSSIAVLGTDVYVGGSFYSGSWAAGRNGIAKWDGSVWLALDKGLNGNGAVNTIAIAGTDVYVGGRFTDVGDGGTPVAGLNRIAKWNPASSTWSAFDNGLNDDVSAIAVAGTDVYAGGRFTDIGGGTSIAGLNNIAKWQVPCVPLVSIAVSPSNIITAGTGVTFTATPTLGGTSPTYQWKKNTIDINGETNATYTTTTLVNNDVISCIMTGNEACASSVTATSNDITMTVTPCVNPIAYSVTGGGSYCTNGAGVSVGLANSQLGVNYQLQVGSVNIGSQVLGGGASISFGNQTAEGIYTVVATNASNNCTANMTGNVLVTINPIPTATIVGNNSPICTSGDAVFTVNGTNGATLTYTLSGLTGLQTLVLTGSNQTITVSAASVNTSLFFLNVSKNGCTNDFSDVEPSSLVTVISLPTATIVSNISPICSGNNATFTVNGTNGATLTYTLTGQANPQTLVLDGTNQTISANGASANVTLKLVSVKIGDCSSVTLTEETSMVTVNPAPTAVVVSNNSPICAGGNAVFTVNGTNGATLTYYSQQSQTLVLNGNNQTITAGGVTIHTPLFLINVTKNGCTVSLLTSPTTPTPNSTVTVNPLVTPLVSITANPSGTISTGTSVTFTATPTFGGASPAYQWKKNTIDINGETNATYTTTTLANNDIISCVMTGNEACASSPTVTSNNITMTVTTCFPPTFYSLTGGGSYCVGGTGVVVGLTNSQMGVSYQLKKDNLNVGGPVAGTGTVISFGNQTTQGTYTVVATTATGGCTADMTGSVSVMPIALPTDIILSGGGISFCGTPLSISMAGSQTGVNYQLKRNNSAQGDPREGTETGLTFTNLTQAGTYTVLATTTLGNCSRAFSAEIIIQTRNAPTAFNLSGGGASCSGSPVGITLANSQVGVFYQLKRANSLVGAPLAGTGNPLSFAGLTQAGNYTVTALTACADLTMNNTVTVNSVVSPSTFSLTGGGTTCGTPLSVGLSGSQTGVFYQLFRDNSPVGTSLQGTGNTLSLGNHLTAGQYTIIATRVGQCATPMSGIATIILLPTLTSFKVTGGGMACAQGVQIGLSGSQNDVTYQLLRGTIPVQTKEGTGSPINFDPQSMAGTYTITANLAGYCDKSMNGNATVTSGGALPNAYAMTGGGPYCNNTPLPLGVSDSQKGVFYQLQRNTGNGFVNAGTTVQGNGNAISLGSHSIIGEYRVVVNSACLTEMAGRKSITLCMARMADRIELDGMINTFAQVIPNPVSNTVYLKVSDAKGQQVKVSLLDQTGRSVIQRAFVAETNQHQEEFEVSHLANGMYFLRINTNDKQTTLKVVKGQ